MRVTASSMKEEVRFANGVVDPHFAVTSSFTTSTQNTPTAAPANPLLQPATAISLRLNHFNLVAVSLQAARPALKGVAVGQPAPHCPPCLYYLRLPPATSPLTYSWAMLPRLVKSKYSIL